MATIMNKKELIEFNIHQIALKHKCTAKIDFDKHLLELDGDPTEALKALEEIQEWAIDHRHDDSLFTFGLL